MKFIEIAQSDHDLIRRFLETLAPFARKMTRLTGVLARYELHRYKLYRMVRH